MIDVGVNRLPDGRLVGDVAYDEAAAIAEAITPVPGGVGPMTITMLLKNTLQAASRHLGERRLRFSLLLLRCGRLMGKGGIAVERTQVPGSPDTKIFTIKQINRYIKMRMDADDILQNVWIRGEISNFKHHSSGHMYFTLKDEESRLRCVMFASANQRLAFMPREGTRVIARGSITVYERDGTYQYYVAEMQPDGIGNLYLAFEQLKQKLAKEGLFAEERKRPIPRFPRAVGVITSPTGAAVRDIYDHAAAAQSGYAGHVYPVLSKACMRCRRSLRRSRR